MTEAANQRLQELVDRVNGALDAAGLLAWIGFRPDETRVSGAMIRAACPVHRDEQFVTLFVNVRQASCRCSVETCPLNNSESLVRLYALVAELTDSAAARALAREFDIGVEAREFDTLAEDYYRTAEQQNANGQTEEAIKSLQEALAVNAHMPEAYLLLGSLREESGDKAMAADAYLHAAEIHHAENRPDEAMRILRQAIDRDLHTFEIYGALVDILVNLGEREAAIVLLRERLAELHTEAVTSEKPASSDWPAVESGHFIVRNEVELERLQVLERLANLSPEDYRIREQIAEQLQKSGAIEEAVNAYTALAYLASEKNDAPKLARYLDRTLDLNPDYREALEWKARLFRREGDKQAASEILARLGAMARERGDDDEARKRWQEALALVPGQIESLDGLAELEEAADSAEEAARWRLTLAKRYSEMGESEKGRKELERLSQTKTDRPEAFIEGSALYLDWDDGGASNEMFFRAIDAYIENDEAEKAQQALQERFDLFDEQTKPWLQAIEKAESLGYHEMALRQRMGLAKTHFEKGQDPAVLEVLAPALTYFAEHRDSPIDAVSYYEYRIAALGRLERLEEKDQAQLDFVDYYISISRINAAERLLIRAISEERRARLFDRLARLYFEKERLEDCAALLIQNAFWLREVSPSMLQKTATDLLRENPGFIMVREPLADAYLSQGRKQEAYEELLQLAERLRIEITEKKDATGEGRQHLRKILHRLVEVKPDDLAVNVQMLAFEIQFGQVSKAREEILRFYREIRMGEPAAVAPLRPLLQYLGGEEDFWNKYIEHLEKQNIGWAKAAGFADAVCILGRGSSLRRDTKMRDLLVRAREIDPAHPGAARLLARMHSADRKKEEGRLVYIDMLDHLEAELEGQPPEEVAPKLLEVYEAGSGIFTNDIDFSERAVERVPILESNSEQRATLWLKLSMALESRIAELAKSDKEEVARLKEREVEVLIQYVELASPPDLQVFGNLIERLHATKHPDYLKYGLDLAFRFFNQRQPNKANAIVRDLIQAHPRAEEPRSLLCDILKMDGAPGELAEVEAEYGDLLMLTRDFARAELHYREALRHDSSVPEYREGLARVFEERGQIDGAAREYGRLATQLRDLGKTPEALRVAEHIGALAPDLTAFLPLLAELQAESGQTEAAGDTYLRAARLAADDRDAAAVARYASHVAELNDRDPAVAEELAELHERTDLRERGARQLSRAIDLYEQKGEWEEAARVANRLLEWEPGNVAARERLLLLQEHQGGEQSVEMRIEIAALHAAKGKWLEAASHYEEIIERLPEGDPQRASILQDCAECFVQAAQPEKAREMLRKLCLETSPKENAELLVRLGRQLVDDAPDDLQIRQRLADAYHQLSKVMPELDQRLRLVKLHLEAGKNKDARVEVEKMEQGAPSSPESLEARAIWLSATKGAAKAAGVYGDLAESLSKEHRFNEALAQAQIILEEEEPELALAVPLLLAATEGDASDGLIKTLDRFFEKAEAAKNYSAAKELLVPLLDLLEDTPAAPGYLERLAIIHEEEGDAKEAAVHFEKLARLQMLAGERKAAIEALKKADGLEGDISRRLRELGRLCEEEGLREEALSYYTKVDRILEEKRATTDSRIAVASKIFELKDGEIESEQNLSRLLEEAGRTRDISHLHLMRVEKLATKEDFQKAISLLRETIRKDSNFLPARRKLAEIYLKVGKKDEARNTLLELADECENGGKPALAAQVLEQIIVLSPRHAEGFLRLADHYSRRNQRAKVEQYLEKGLNILISDGKVDQALELLSKDEAGGQYLASRQELLSQLFALERLTDAARQGMQLIRLFLKHGQSQQAWMMAQKLALLRRRQPKLIWGMAEAFSEAGLKKFSFDIREQAVKQLEEEGLYEDAWKMLEEVLEERPDSIALLRIAVKLAERDSSDEADAEPPAKERDPSTWRWRLLDTLERIDESGDELEPTEQRYLLEKLLRENPEDERANRRLAEFESQVGQPEHGARRLVSLAETWEQEGRPVSDQAGLLRRATQIAPYFLEAHNALFATLQKDKTATQVEVQEAIIGQCDALISLERFDEAEEKLKKLITEEPRHLQALRRLCNLYRDQSKAEPHWKYGYKLGTLLQEVEQPEEAQQIYEDAVVMDGDNLEAWEALGSLVQKLGDSTASPKIFRNLARAHLNRGNFDNATQALEQLLEKFPGEWDAVLEAVRSNIESAESHRFALLLRLAIAAAEDERRRVSSDTASGEHAEWTSDSQEKLEELYRRFLANAPDETKMRRRLAESYQMGGKSSAASDEWAVLASYYRVENKWENAAEAMEQQWELQHDATVLIRLYTLLKENGEEVRANEAVYKKIKQLTEKGETKAALVHAEAILETAGDNIEIHRLAVRAADLEKNEGALKKHRAAMARIAMETGDLEEAEALISGGGQDADSDDPEIRLTRAALLERRGEEKEATLQYEKLALAPEDSEISSQVRLKAVQALIKIAPNILVYYRAEIDLLKALDKTETAQHKEAALIERLLEKGEDDELLSSLLRGIASERADSGEGIQPVFSTKQLAEWAEAAAQREVLGPDAAMLFAQAAREALADDKENAQEWAALALSSDPHYLEGIKVYLEVNPDAASSVADEARFRLAKSHHETGDREAALALLEARPIDETAPLISTRLINFWLGLLEQAGSSERILELAASWLNRTDDKQSGTEDHENDSKWPLHEDRQVVAEKMVEASTDEPSLLIQALTQAGSLIDDETRDDHALTLLTDEAFYSLDDLHNKIEDFQTLLTPDGRAWTFYELLRAALTYEGKGLAPVEAADTFEEFWKSFTSSDEPIQTIITDHLADLLNRQIKERGEFPALAYALASLVLAQGNCDKAKMWLERALKWAEVLVAAEMPALTHQPSDYFETDPGRLGDNSSDPGLRSGEAEGTPAIPGPTKEKKDKEKNRTTDGSSAWIGRLYYRIIKKLQVYAPDEIHLLEALLLLSEKMQEWKDFGHYGVLLAQQLEELDENERAINVYRRLIAIYPQELAAHEALLSLLPKMISPEQAAEEFHRASMRLLSAGNPERAPRHRQMSIRLLEEAAKLAPNSLNYLLELIDVRESSIPAEETANERIKLGHLALDVGNVNVARAQCAEAMRILGEDNEDAQRLDNAIKHQAVVTPTPENELPEAISFQPRETTNDEYEEAVENFLVVIRLDPDNLEAHQALAMTYAQMDNQVGELLHQKEVMRLLEHRGRWEDLLTMSEDMLRRFPGRDDLVDIAQRVRNQVRMLDVLDEDIIETQADSKIRGPR